MSDTEGEGGPSATFTPAQKAYVTKAVTKAVNAVRAEMQDAVAKAIEATKDELQKAHQKALADALAEMRGHVAAVVEQAKADAAKAAESAIKKGVRDAFPDNRAIILKDAHEQAKALVAERIASHETQRHGAQDTEAQRKALEQLLSPSAEPAATRGDLAILRVELEQLKARFDLAGVPQDSQSISEKVRDLTRQMSEVRADAMRAEGVVSKLTKEYNDKLATLEGRIVSLGASPGSPRTCDGGGTTDCELVEQKDVLNTKAWPIDGLRNPYWRKDLKEKIDEKFGRFLTPTNSATHAMKSHYDIVCGIIDKIGRYVKDEPDNVVAATAISMSQSSIDDTFEEMAMIQARVTPVEYGGGAATVRILEEKKRVQTTSERLSGIYDVMNKLQELYLNAAAKHQAQSKATDGKGNGGGGVTAGVGTRVCLATFRH